MSRIKKRLEAVLEAMLNSKGGVVKPSRGDNKDRYLAAIYVAQETKSWAEARLKQAWVDAQIAGLVPDDALLRNKGKGEHLVCDSSQFSALATVQNPRDNFSKDAFIKAVAERFKIDEGQLKGIADTCLVKSAAPLSKRVLEAQ